MSSDITISSHQSDCYYQIYGSEPSKDLQPVHFLFREKLLEVLKNIHRLDSFFRDSLAMLSHQQNSLSRVRCRFAMETILGLAYLEEHAEEISQIPVEKARNEKITQDTGLVAESGLISGKEPDEIKQMIRLRIEEVASAYYFDIENETTTRFFEQAFVGPPCFNGRVITLENYVLEKQLRVPNFIFQTSTDIDPRACEMENLLYECIEKTGLSKTRPPSLEQVKLFIEGDPALAKAWGGVNSPEFARIYSRACDFFNYLEVN